MEKNSKKELKIVLNAELYDELKYTFRPDQLENIIYKPEVLGEKKWQCCCGSESELEICPICGMEKNTVLSKVNANYLAHHRKMRIARKRKAMQDQQAMMAAQIIKKTKKNKPAKKTKESNKKLGTIIGVILLCLAVIISIAIIFGGKGDNVPAGKPVDSTDFVSNETPDNKTPDETKPSEDETTPAETTPPETVVIPEVITVPSEAINKNPATLKDGTWSKGASGNTSAGSLVFSGDTYDFVCIEGLRMFEKNGTEVGVITENKVIGVTGYGNNIFYLDEAYSIHRYNLETKQDVMFSIKAKQICSYFDELYYVPAEENGLFVCNNDGYKTKTVTTLEVFAISNTAEKLYFSTNESLAVVTSKDGNVLTFCKDGAKATSILEITNCVFYTSSDGKLKFFFPQKYTGFGIEYPIYDVNITHVSAFENRVYVKTVNPRTNAVLWYATNWTAGTKLFTPAKFASTGITTDSLYVSNNAIFDSNLVRKPVA